MNKTEAFEFCNNIISELNGNWINKTFNNLGWVVQVDSLDCVGLYMIYNEGCDSWSVYCDPEGYQATGKTAEAALNSFRLVCINKIKIRESEILDLQNIMLLLE
jgi:hypothetical protein